MHCGSSYCKATSVPETASTWCACPCPQCMAARFLADLNAVGYELRWTDAHRVSVAMAWLGDFVQWLAQCPGGLGQLAGREEVVQFASAYDFKWKIGKIPRPHIRRKWKRT